MSLYISSINSGSNGNCYYIGNGKEAVLVDVGISCREIERRMKRLELSLEKVKAIFISHEHSDHIKGVEVLSRKYEIPVYISEQTYSNSNLNLESSLIRYFSSNEVIAIGALNIHCFDKIHDAVDPYSFSVEHMQTRVGIFTDIGSACDNLVNSFRSCHAAFLEANYDRKMLEQGRYPYYLKKRITSGHGHLSNDQALELFLNHRPEFMSHLILAHLSRDNNDPQLVKDLFEQHAGDTEIVVASRYGESEVFFIGQADAVRMKNKVKQMSLF